MLSFRNLFSICAALCLLLVSTSAFANPAASTSSGRSMTSVATPSSTRLNFFGPKDDGSPGDYVCLDCGWVFTKGPKAWADLPGDWSCPPCGSVKRRFKKVPKGQGGK